MADEDKREFWKYALFTAITSVLVGHMFYTMWLNGAWRFASELTSSIGWVPDGATGVTAGLLFGFGIYLGFLLVFMQNRKKYYQGVILLVGTAVSLLVLGALGIGLPGFEPSALNVGAFAGGLAVVVLAEMISTEITLPLPDLSDDDGFLRTIELEGRLHQIDLERSSWGHAVDIRGDPLQFPVATYGLLGYIIAVVLVSNALNFVVGLPGVGSLQIAHLAFSLVFLWVLGSFLSLNPSSDAALQVLGPTQSGKTYFVLAAALEAQRNDRFEMASSTGWINELIENHKEWARKNREIADRELDWDIGFTELEQIYKTNFTVTTNDRIPKAFHFNVVDHAGEILGDVADRVGRRAVTDGGTNEETSSVDYICPECGHETSGSKLLSGDKCPECQGGYLQDLENYTGGVPTDDESATEFDSEGELNDEVASFGSGSEASTEGSDSATITDGETTDDEAGSAGPFSDDRKAFDADGDESFGADDWGDDAEPVDEAPEDGGGPVDDAAPDNSAAPDDTATSDGAASPEDAVPSDDATSPNDAATPDDTAAQDDAATADDTTASDDDDAEGSETTDAATTGVSTDDGTETANTTDNVSDRYDRTGDVDAADSVGEDAEFVGEERTEEPATGNRSSSVEDRGGSIGTGTTDNQRSGSAESLSQREVIDRLEEKVLESDTLLFMLDCERLIGRAPAGVGSESLETTEMNRIVNGAEPDRVILVGTKADILIDDWKPWHRAHHGSEVDSDRLPDPHEVERYERSFREYVTERFRDEAGMLLNNADTNTVYPVYFETEMVDTGDEDGPTRDRRDDDVEWVPVPNEHGELQPHGYDHVLSAIATDG